MAKLHGAGGFGKAAEGSGRVKAYIFQVVEL